MLQSSEDEPFDLLTTVEQGGCSAKLNAEELSKLLAQIPIPVDANVLVDISTHDDAGVYKISDDTALIFTTDFFPPVCSGATDFGHIAAANSLSDVYAMGGKPLLALNITMFPSAQIPTTVLRDVLAAGQEKINEAGALTMGGHTIDDYPPKYGLAVVGTVHPERVITNANARVGDKLILTKPIGTGIVIAAQKLGMVSDDTYRLAIEGMKQLNDFGADIMQRFGVRAATDITGFSLAGHLLKMAQASGVSAEIASKYVPFIGETLELADDGCIPGAAFRNLRFVEPHCLWSPHLSANVKMALCDAQTSGGLLMCVPPQNANSIVEELKLHYPYSAIIGTILPKSEYALRII